MNLSKIPFLRIIVPFVGGIILTSMEPSWFIPSIMIPLIVLFFVLLVIFTLYPDYHKRTLVASSFFVMLFLTGSLVTHLHDISQRPNFIGKILPASKACPAILHIQDEVQEKPTYFRAIANIQTIYLDSHWIPVKGKVLLWIEKNNSSPKPNYGDILFTYLSLNEIKPRILATDFNFKQYLANKNIYHQAYLASDAYAIIGKKANPVKEFFLNVKKRLILHILTTMNYDETAWLLVAMLTGAKSDLSPEIIQSYQASGLMHILAVSGLHVGIIYLFITMIFRLFNKNRKKRRTEVIISLITIWFYAALTGLTPSILRASIMLTLLLGAQLLKRKVNSFNVLFASMFIILLIDPFSLFEVSFILSFSAVGGILLFYPLLDKMVYSKYHFLNQLWSLVSVSLSAQLGTLPAILYFFGQFPVYFLLANIIVTPFVSILLIISLIALLLGLIPLFTPIVGWILKELFWFFITIPNTIASWPFSSIQPVYIALPTTLLLGFSILLFYFAITTKKIVFFYTSILLIFLSTLVQQHWQHQEKNKIFVSYIKKRNSTLIAIKDKKLLTVYVNNPHPFSREFSALFLYAKQFRLAYHVLLPHQELPYALNEFPYLAYKQYFFFPPQTPVQKNFSKLCPTFFNLLKYGHVVLN
jgi:competence protein ComEC